MLKSQSRYEQIVNTKNNKRLRNKVLSGVEGYGSHWTNPLKKGAKNEVTRGRFVQKKRLTFVQKCDKLE